MNKTFFVFWKSHLNLLRMLDILSVFMLDFFCYIAHTYTHTYFSELSFYWVSRHKMYVTGNSSVPCKAGSQCVM